MKPDIFEHSGYVKGTSELVKCPSFVFLNAQLIKAFNSLFLSSLASMTRA